MVGQQQKELFTNFTKEDFKFINLLGKGSFGEVHRCLHVSSGLTFAIKTIDLEKADDDIDDIQKEISFQGQCDHPNITPYYSSQIVGTQLWILMEYLGGGSAYDLLKLGSLEDVYIATIMKEVLKGLSYLHDENKIHRDIKSANILLSDKGQVKLADFGVAGQLTNTLHARSTFVGTPFWMAPEVIKQSNYNYKADIWSLGITLYELATGFPPHHQLHPMKALFAICKDNSPELDSSFSKNIRDFCLQCLNKDPEARPAAKVLLKHKFMKSAKRTSILTDLIEKLKTLRSKDEKKKDGDVDMMTPKINVEEPNWIFDTVKKTQTENPFTFETDLTKEIVSEESEITREDDILLKDTEVISSSLNSLTDLSSLESLLSRSKTQPYEKIEKRTNSSKVSSPRTMQMSKLGILRNKRATTSSEKDTSKDKKKWQPFNSILIEVVQEHDVDGKEASLFMSHFSSKPELLPKLCSYIVKLANKGKN